MQALLVLERSLTRSRVCLAVAHRPPGVNGHGPRPIPAVILTHTMHKSVFWMRSSPAIFSCTLHPGQLDLNWTHTGQCLQFDAC